MVADTETICNTQHCPKGFESERHNDRLIQSQALGCTHCPQDRQLLNWHLHPRSRPMEMALFALATGLRQSNVLGLEWEQLNLELRHAWVKGTESKNRRPISIPLNDTAMACIQRQIGKPPTRVFSYRGRLINWVNAKAWQAALKRADINDFRWHDLRHTWAAWQRQAGTPTHGYVTTK